MRNPLMLPLIALLRAHPDGCREFDLIKAIEADGGFPALAEDSQLALFQKHFLVKNALYQLQATLWEEEGLYVSITPLLIRLEQKAAIDRSGSNLPGDAGEQSVREYYLDWQEYESATVESVEALLDSFWQRYCSQDQRLEALTVLELPADSDPATIKKQYRRLANQHHPDKGGDSQHFIALRQAWETLRASC